LRHINDPGGASSVAGAPNSLPRLLLRACTAQDVGNRAVTFVAGVLENLPVVGVPLPGDRKRPPLRPRRGIIDRDFDPDRVGVHPCVALDQAQGVSRSFVVRLITEIGDLDNQRVALPTAARASDPLTDAGREGRVAVDRGHPRLVEALIENRYGGRTLPALQTVVVL